MSRTNDAEIGTAMMCSGCLLMIAAVTIYLT
ncbi:MAG: hypothetical protein JWQ77_620 [Jatrophihabitans sp.]|nr:hypothetical protein [Jatrophihabitans sp.]